MIDCVNLIFFNLKYNRFTETSRKRHYFEAMHVYYEACGSITKTQHCHCNKFVAFLIDYHDQICITAISFIFGIRHAYILFVIRFC